MEKQLFRFHRGSLSESMKTVVEVKNMQHLTEIVKEAFPELENLKISVEPYGVYDHRIGWDTHVVIADHKTPRMKKDKQKAQAQFLKRCLRTIHPIGFTNKMISNEG